MSSKKGAKKGTGESKSDHIPEPTLQAVLLIDTYNLYFSPLCSECSPSLFPVANEPILSYTLHFLRTAGVQELLIVGRHCSKEVYSCTNYLVRSLFVDFCFSSTARINTFYRVFYILIITIHCCHYGMSCQNWSPGPILAANFGFQISQ